MTSPQPPDPGGGDDPEPSRSQDPDRSLSGAAEVVAPAEEDAIGSRAPADARLVGNASAWQLARNFTTGYVGLLGSAALSLVLTPIVLDHLGATDYGLWILIITVGTYVGLLGAGVGTAAVREVATETALGNVERVADVLATARAFYLLSSIAALGITGAFIPFVGDVFAISHHTLSAARWGLLLMAGFSIVGFLTAVPVSALTGSGMHDRVALISLAVNVGTQAAQIGVVFAGGGVVALVATTVTGTALGWAANEWVARRLGLLRSGRPNRALLRDLTRSGVRNATVSIGGTITYGLDTFVIGAILPVRKVAPYDLALSTVTFVRSFASSATDLLLPTYAHSTALDDQDRVFRLFSRAVAASMALTCPASIALIGFGQPLLRLWLHHVPAQTYEILVVMNVVYFLQLPGHQTFVYLTGAGRNRLLARIALPLALLNLGLSVGATFIFGAVGPAVGNLPQMAIVDFWLLPLVSCRTMGRRFRDYVRMAMLPLVPPAAVATGATLALRLALPSPPLLLAPVEAVAVVVVALIAVLPLLARLDPDIRTSLRRLRARLRLRLPG